MALPTLEEMAERLTAAEATTAKIQLVLMQIFASAEDGVDIDASAALREALQNKDVRDFVAPKDDAEAAGKGVKYSQERELRKEHAEKERKAKEEEEAKRKAKEKEKEAP